MCTAGRLYDYLARSVHIRRIDRNGLIGIACCVTDGRNVGCTHRQGNIVGQLVGIKAFDGLSVEGQILQAAVSGSLQSEGQFVDLRRGIARTAYQDLVGASFYLIGGFIDNRLLAILIARYGLNGGHRCSAERERYLVIGQIGHKACHRLTVHQYVLQGIVAQQCHFEADGIGTLRRSVGGGNSNRGGIAERCGLNDLKSLTVLLHDTNNHRNGCSAVRQVDRQIG